jgi:hypothetical protein
MGLHPSLGNDSLLNVLDDLTQVNSWHRRSPPPNFMIPSGFFLAINHNLNFKFNMYHTSRQTQMQALNVSFC